MERPGAEAGVPAVRAPRRSGISAAYREPEPWLTVGDVLDPGLQAPARGASGADVSRVALSPSGQRISLDGDGPEVLELAEQGFYEFRAQGRDGDPPVVVASNVESGGVGPDADGPPGSRRRGDGPGWRDRGGGTDGAAE